MRDYKTHTSKELQAAIKNSPVESRREWLVWIACSDGEVFSGFERAAQKNCNVKNGQFWQQNNKPIELVFRGYRSKSRLYSSRFYRDPVEAGFVNEPEHWRYSSAIDYAGGKGLIEIDFV